MTTTERSDFSRFGKTFQENLVQLILMDRPFCDQIREVFAVEFLELKYLQAFVNIVFSYKDKYKIHPTFDIMTTLLRTGLEDQNETVQKQVRDYFARMQDSEPDGAQFIKETSLDFCKKQKLKEAVEKAKAERDRLKQLEKRDAQGFVMKVESELGVKQKKRKGRPKKDE